MNGKLLILLFLFFAQRAFSQNVSGIVLDEKKQPVIGVVVQLVGTQYGAATDLDGKFKISNVPPGKYKVKFNYTGLTSQVKDIEVGTADIELGNITMKDDPQQLDEFVKVGYGVQRKRELTSSIGKISGKELNDLPVQSFEQGIQGKLAGVVVTQGSGLAGSPSIIRIRGISSISASGDPLYVIDGIPISQDYGTFGNAGGFNNNPLATINPDDIESIEVLKDAAATSIWGSRGSNGVVMVTTKRAKAGGKLNVTYTGQLGFSTPTAKPKTVTAGEFLQLYEEAWINDGNVGKPDLRRAGIPMDWDDAKKNNTNWLDETTQTGIKQQHSIGISKGWKKASVYTGASYANNETFLKGNSYERISGRINADFQVTKRLKASVTSSLSRGVNSRVYSGWSGGFGLVMSSALPIYPVKNPDGSYFLFNNSDAGFKTNPVMMLDLFKWQTKELKNLSGAALDYEIAKNLTARVQGNIDYTDVSDNQFAPVELNKAISNTNQSSSYRNASYTFNYNYTAQLNYKFDLNKNNHFEVLGGFERQRSVTNGFVLTGVDMDGFFTSNTVDNSIPGNNRTEKLPSEWIFERYFSRATYNFRGKYFLGATMSYDGSSRFGNNYRYGAFPAVSAGWIISDERLMLDNNFISFLKLRTSYGKSGNSNFENNARFGFFQLSPSQPYNGQPILYPTKLENPNLRWETSWTFNAGLDFGILKDRISGTVEYYNRQTSDVIMNLSIDPSNGFSSYYDNVGGISNSGVEFSLKTVNVDARNFKWTTNFNIARNWNELTSTGNYTEDAVSGGTNDTRAVVGSPVGTYYMVRFSRVDKETGKPVYLDKNGNETFTWDAANRVPVGSVLPKATGGLTNTFQYKNWDLSLLFCFQIGGNIYDASAKRQLGVVTYWNMRPEIADRWQKPGDDATFPRLTLNPATYGLPNEWQYNTPMWIYDASFLRLRNVTIGYRLPKAWLEKVRIASARIAFIGTNLYVWTKYPGLDPEIARDGEGDINQSRNLQAQNTYYLNAPQERTYNFQVSLTF